MSGSFEVDVIHFRHRYERPDHTIKLMGIAFLCLSRHWAPDFALFCQKAALSNQKELALQRIENASSASGSGGVAVGVALVSGAVG